MTCFTSFSRDRTFPLNAWYAAAWDYEVKRALLPRTIANKQIVMYRTTIIDRGGAKLKASRR
jgi:hypothetical protein